MLNESSLDLNIIIFIEVSTRHFEHSSEYRLFTYIHYVFKFCVVV